MHTEVREYINKIKEKLPDSFIGKNVLEVGSQNINGTVRDYFIECSYIGIDLYDGKDVDIVVNVNDYNSDMLFDTIISTEALEHDKLWDKSILKMYDLLKIGGLLLVTCAGINRYEHGTTRTSPKNSPGTLDYYRNISKEDVLGTLPNAIIEENEDQTDIRFYLIKQ